MAIEPVKNTELWTRGWVCNSMDCNLQTCKVHILCGTSHARFKLSVLCVGGQGHNCKDGAGGADGHCTCVSLLFTCFSCLLSRHRISIPRKITGNQKEICGGLVESFWGKLFQNEFLFDDLTQGRVMCCVVFSRRLAFTPHVSLYVLHLSHVQLLAIINRQFFAVCGYRHWQVR